MTGVAVVGGSVTGAAVVGGSVTGAAVVGGSVTGVAVVGAAVVGAAVVGTTVDGGEILTGIVAAVGGVVVSDAATPDTAGVLDVLWWSAASTPIPRESDTNKPPLTPATIVRDLAAGWTLRDISSLLSSNGCQFA